MMAESDLVLVCAPRGRDGALACKLLERHGLRAAECPSLDELVSRITSAGCAVITAELMTSTYREQLSAALAKQPPWADFPIVLFTAPNSDRADEVLAAIQLLGNVTILERPVRSSALVSAVVSALRGRRRQYEARDAIHRRDQFLAMLGHELRNPLAAIMLALETMPSAAGDPHPKQRLIIDRQTRHLARLVDDLLDVARVTTGKVRVEREPIDLRDVIERCLHGAELAARARSIELRATPCPTPMIVDGDLVRLEEVFSNLLSNAIKYSPEHARVDIRAHVDGRTFVVEVVDTGIGMTPGVLARVFDLFAQADPSLDRSQGGLGIGLTLVRSLLELHGGTITASSAGLGHGSTFVVRLPASRTANQRIAVPHLTLVEAPHELGVVLVDDNLDLLEMTRDLLTIAGCAVTTAADGPSGLDEIVTRQPDIAFVDIGLPGIDGYDVARRVRANHLETVFLVAMTGYGQPEDKQRALAAGFDLHLTKPVTTGSLQAALTVCQDRQVARLAASARP